MTGHVQYPRRTPPSRARAVCESAAPGRRPRVGDRVFWHGARVGFVGAFARREGTITAVYLDPARPPNTDAFPAPHALLFDVEWDEPAPGDPAPWTGTSRGLRAALLHTRGWGWVR